MSRAQVAPTSPVVPHTAYAVADLLAAKSATGLTVSVVIPARDEEATVAAVVEVVMAAWVHEHHLVDEVIVIDSDSVDATAQQARAAGATVHSAAAIRPDLGSAQGKGEALWKSQFVASGDVVAFLDADLVDWGPHFVPGLVGPLLTDPETHLVKAVYHRPLLNEQGRESESGGRVTELVARPVLALHWPELAGVVQPLSGEWAIRAVDLAQLSIPVGYGVEIAALIDMCRRWGPGAIAQVDLGRRAHRHHRHDTLGPMAVQVLAAAEARLPACPDHGAHQTSVPLRQFEPTTSGFRPIVRSVDVLERPPAASLTATPA